MRLAASTISMRGLIGPLLIAAALPLAAQSGSPLRLELKCRKSPCTFQIGELIPIELRFSSSIPKHYQLNMATYDRSGRTHFEAYSVAPGDGTRDPLEIVFSFGGFIGGGLTGFEFLSSEPVAVKLVLNEWVTFEQPGNYRMRVTSSRVTDTTLHWNEKGSSPEVASNEMDLTVVPADKQWQQLELRRIVAALDANPTAPSGPSDPAAEPLTALRYLGTEEAARELARRLATGEANLEWQCMFGLIGSPHAAEGLAEMRALLRDANVAVTPMFLRAMSYLQLRAGQAPRALQEQFQQDMESSRKELVTALPLKQGKALAVSTETALQDLSAGAPEAQRKSLSHELLHNFESLPVESQASWLQYRWDTIKDRSWLPVLQKIAASSKDYAERREWHAYQSLAASGAALKRWYELDPAGARNSVIAEIVRPRPRYGVSVLGMLEDTSLPDVEWTLVENLAKTTDYEIEGNILALLERFGTGAAASNLIGSREEQIGKSACLPQAAFLGYILKFDPEAAQPLIQRAIEARGEPSNACRQSIFTDLGAKHQSPVLEDLAVNSLNDPDPQVAGNAAEYLGRYGTAAAEQPLWTRYLSWSRDWRGREKELRTGFGASENPNLWQSSLGQNLARALAEGNGWFYDDAKLRRLLDVAVGEGDRSMVESAVQSASGRAIGFIPNLSEPPGTYRVAQYDQLTIEQLRSKLAQFPAATVFHWASFGPAESPEQVKGFREATDAAAKSGMKLLRD